MFLGDESLVDIPKVRDYVRAEGKAEDAFSIWGVLQDRRGAGLDKDTLIASADRWRDARANHISVCSMRRGFTTIDAHIDYLAEAGHNLGLS
jgi:hypothetical protein